MNSAYLSVTTAATLLNTDTSTSGGTIGNTVIVKNLAAGQIVYIGGATVTADAAPGTAGFPLAAGESITITCAEGEGLYGIVAATTQNVNVLRQGAN